MAQPAGDEAREKAVAHYNQAEAYFRAETFDKAALEYERAYALVPRPGLLFNIALAHEKGGARDKAIASYERYIAEEPSGARVNEARARLESLIRERDQSAAATITIEGHRRRADDNLGQGKHLDAIAELRELHKLTAEPGVLFEIARAYEDAGEDELAYKEYARYLETGHREHAEDALARRKTIEAKRAAARAPDKLPPFRRPSILLPAIASGVSAALFGVAIGTGLKARSIESELEGDFEALDPPLDNGDPRFDDGRSAATVANVFFVGAGVAAAASGYLWWRFFRQRGEREPTSTTYLVPTGNGLAIGGAF